MRINVFLSFLFFVCICLTTTNATYNIDQMLHNTYNVMEYGAIPDGVTDSTDSFSTCWSLACNSEMSAKVYVPYGTFLLKKGHFKGPCRNNHIIFEIEGTIVASSEPYYSSHWISFDRVEGVIISGGLIDGQGQNYWDCKRANGANRCGEGTKSLTIAHSRDVTIYGLTSKDSKFFHILISECEGVRLEQVKIFAPEHSPNTDGIHTIKSRNTTIEHCEIRTGDDCISIGQGTNDLRVHDITCGPGHGISIGSLASKPGERDVHDISVSQVLLSGTTNGVRIKTWAKPNRVNVHGVTFQDIQMENVRRPIIIDQNYCPHHKCKKMKHSGAKIVDVEYKNIRGLSADVVAVHFDCSPSNPCERINMESIDLNHPERPTESYCNNAQVLTSGLINPPTCY